MTTILPASGPFFQLGVFFLLSSSFFYDLMMLRLVLAHGFVAGVRDRHVTAMSHFLVDVARSSIK